MSHANNALWELSKYASLVQKATISMVQMVNAKKSRKEKYQAMVENALNALHNHSPILSNNTNASPAHSNAIVATITKQFRLWNVIYVKITWEIFMTTMLPTLNSIAQFMMDQKWCAYAVTHFTWGIVNAWIWRTIILMNKQNHARAAISAHMINLAAIRNVERGSI